MVETMYPAGFQTHVEVGEVAQPLEGAARPGHFRGVATVVTKLFQIVPADVAFFGQKDYQQTLVVKQLVADLAIPIEIRVCPTIREPDGLALSSRNARLSPAERKLAASLWQALQLTELLHGEGTRDADAMAASMHGLLARQGEIAVDYIAFLEAGTVRPVATITGPTVVAIAARIGETRLIDNHTIG
jgi:pantoate--beta-alanine ligase